MFRLVSRAALLALVLGVAVLTGCNGSNGTSPKGALGAPPSGSQNRIGDQSLVDPK